MHGRAVHINNFLNLLQFSISNKEALRVLGYSVIPRLKIFRHSSVKFHDVPIAFMDIFLQGISKSFDLDYTSVDATVKLFRDFYRLLLCHGKK